MSTTLSDYAENKVTDHVLGTTNYAFVAQLYLGLFTTNPNFETGVGGVEAAGGSYVRKAINFDAASGGVTQQDGALVWTVGTDVAAQTMTGWGVFDASSGGNMMFGDTFAANKALSGTGDILTFADATGITFSLT